MSMIEQRIKRIEAAAAIDDNTEWLKLPDPENPGEKIEVKGHLTLASLLKTLFGAKDNERR